MYWRTTSGSLILWIACLTLAFCAAAASMLAGSRGGALSFLAAAAVLAPPAQELIARVRHHLAPAKAALLAIITLVPIGLGFVAVDGIANLDREAVSKGFQSAGQWARAKDLKLATPQALAAHDEAERRRGMETHCRERAARPPLDCFEPEHQRAGRAFVAVLLGGEELEALARDALARQRKAYSSIDRECADLLDRIDEDALPVILSNREAMLAVASGAWVRHFSKAELEQMLARSKPGASFLVSADSKALEQKLAATGQRIEQELESVLQAWARRIVMTEPSWRAFLKGRTAMARCRPAEQAGH